MVRYSDLCRTPLHRAKVTLTQLCGTLSVGETDHVEQTERVDEPGLGVLARTLPQSISANTIEQVVHHLLLLLGSSLGHLDTPPGTSWPPDFPPGLLPMAVFEQEARNQEEQNPHGVCWWCREDLHLLR